MLTGAHYIPNLGLLCTSITSGTDAAVVQRSWGIFQQEPALREHAYGPNFTYREFMKTRNIVSAMFMHYGLIVGGALLAFCSPFRNLIRRFVFQPGQGPSKGDAANDYIEYRGVATPDLPSASGKQALCRAWFQGSMYLREYCQILLLLYASTLTRAYLVTGVFLAQAARTLLEDDIKLSGGVYTPACLGQGYIDRLGEAGFKTETKFIER